MDMTVARIKSTVENADSSDAKFVDHDDVTKWLDSWNKQ